MEYPWIIVRKDGNTWTCEGTPTYEAGHRIPLADGRTDGIYCGWTFDNGTLRVENDRYGIKPLFYCYHNNQLMLSPSVIQLIAQGAPTDLDDAAMAVFLRLGFFLGEDTPFAAIRAMPPGAQLSWDESKPEIVGNPAICEAREIQYEDAVDGYIDLFQQAMSRRPPTSDRTAVPLSGGRDSRHIFLELHRSGNLPKEAVTIRRYRPVDGDDLSTAALVAEAAGVPHVALVPKESYTSYESRKNAITHMCTDEMWWALPVADYLARRVDCIWDGLGGDVLSAGKGSRMQTEEVHQLYRSGQLEEVADKEFDRWGVSEQAVSGIVSPEQLAKCSRDKAMDRTIRELSKFQNAAAPLSAFYFWNRMRREVALSPHMLMDVVPTAYTPFLDHDLYDFLAAIPAEFLAKHKYHTDVILKAYPSFASIPFAHDAKAQTFSLALAPLQALRSTVGLLRLARGVAPHYTPIIRRWAWNKLRRRPAGNMPRRMMHYFIDIEGIRTQQGARDMLTRV